MLLQLNPTIPVDTIRGSGEAIGWLDYSQEHDLLWIVALDETGEVWCIPNQDIRLMKNYSVGRMSLVDERREQWKKTEE